MTYTSAGFYVFLLVLLALYYGMPLRLRWVVLLAGSMAFYVLAYKTGWWIVLASAVMNYAAGIFMDMLESRQTASRGWLKRAVFLCAVFLNLLPWFCMKNGNFILGSLLHRPAVSWIVPLGISFYTLQSVAYLADVYRGSINAQRNPAKFALFVLFFPHMVQGPIPRYGQLAKQLYEGHAFDETVFVKGFQQILWGFFLKLMIADKAAVIVNEVFDHPGRYTGCYVLVAGALYSIELYADFLSCTKLSQGAAGLFGIRLADNFSRPYLAVSVKEFWRRWHMSLSSWLRDYIYIPLGGSRKGNLHRYVNLALTFAASGIWHGPGYKFLFWGLLHAAYQTAGSLTQGLQESIYRFLGLAPQSRLRRALQRLGVFFWVMLAWILFRAESLTAGFGMIKSMFTVHNPWIFANDSLFALGLGWKEWAVFCASLAVLAAAGHLQEKGTCIREAVLARPLYIRWALYILAAVCTMVFGTYGFGFDAQDFIYRGF